MFAKDGSCTGIQRIRGEELSDPEPRKIATPSIVLPDHLNVMTVGFDHEAKNLISVSTEHDVAIRTWDLSEKKLQHEVKLETDRVGNFFLTGHLTLSADCQRVAATLEGQVGIWDASTGKLIKMIPPKQQSRAESVGAFSTLPDFFMVAGVLTSGFGLTTDVNAVVWKADSGNAITRVTHADAMQLHCVALSPDGKWLATGGQRAGTKVWDIDSGSLNYALPNDNQGRKHPDAEVHGEAADQVLCLGFSPDSSLLAIGDLFGVKLFDAKSGELVHQIDAPFRYGQSGMVV